MTQTFPTLASIADTEDDAHELFPFSRSAGLLSQSGNADSEVKTRLSDDAADDLRKLARSFGMTVSEFVRITLLTRMYGVSGVTRMAQEHLALVSGEAQQSVPQREPV